jgi:hypothetical protein
MNTNQTADTTYLDDPSLDDLLELYFDPAQTPFTIAKRLRITTLALNEMLLHPHIAGAIATIAALNERRAPHLASGTLQNLLALVNKTPAPSPTATSQDVDRFRRLFDSTRRAAELLYKMHTPKPLVKAAAKSSDAHPTPFTAFSSPARSSPSTPSAHAPAAGLSSEVLSTSPSTSQLTHLKRQAS